MFYFEIWIFLISVFWSYYTSSILHKPEIWTRNISEYLYIYFVFGLCKFVVFYLPFGTASLENMERERGGEQINKCWPQKTTNQHDEENIGSPKTRESTNNLHIWGEYVKIQKFQLIIHTEPRQSAQQYE